jgi:hypothetical protein
LAEIIEQTGRGDLGRANLAPITGTYVRVDRRDRGSSEAAQSIGPQRLVSRMAGSGIVHRLISWAGSMQRFFRRTIEDNGYGYYSLSTADTEILEEPTSSPM